MKLNSINKNKIKIASIFLIMALLVVGILLTGATPKGEVYAKRRVLAMTEAANKNNPEGVYPYLTKELKAICSKEQFVKNWNHERTYPYLIPFYVFFRDVTLDESKTHGTSKFERAARLPGQFEEYGIVYENGNYYFDAFHSIADGSYIEIFDRLK